MSSQTVIATGVVSEPPLKIMMRENATGAACPAANSSSTAVTVAAARHFVGFMRGRGARKVMFGTNYPMLTAGACLEGLASLELGEEATELFLHRNARRVFKLDPVGARAADPCG